MPEPQSQAPLLDAAQVIILPATPPNDPPPPYPSRERRRAGRSGRRRRTIVGETDHLHVPSTGTESEHDSLSPTIPSPFPSLDLDNQDDNVTESTPLLSSPRLPSGGISRRQRTLSISSTLHSTTSVAPSFAQTVISAFHPDRDCDLDPDEPPASDTDENEFLDSPTPRSHVPGEDTRLFAAEFANARIGRRTQSFGGRCRRYFKPLMRRAYYSALFHLLVLNFPYALLAWVYLFVFTLVSTNYDSVIVCSSNLTTWSYFRRRGQRP